MILITSDAELRRFVPNTLVTVAGEATLFEKLHTYLETAEVWFEQRFINPASLDSLLPNETTINLAKRIVIAEAMYRAIPALDLVLTPNGFGIVSNQNVVPASKERVERLIASQEAYRDQCIRQLLPFLHLIHGWSDSEQGQYFGATLFPFLDIAPLLGYKEGVFRRYEEFRPRIIEMENELADKFISQPLYARLRKAYLTDACNIMEVDMVRQLRAIELSLLRGEQLNIRKIHTLVTQIRKNVAVFPEWFTSETAAHFTDQSFHNKKQSGGYWF